MNHPASGFWLMRISPVPKKVRAQFYHPSTKQAFNLIDTSSEPLHSGATFQHGLWDIVEVAAGDLQEQTLAEELYEMPWLRLDQRTVRMMSTEETTHLLGPQYFGNEGPSRSVQQYPQRQFQKDHLCTIEKTHGLTPNSPGSPLADMALLSRVRSAPTSTPTQTEEDVPPLPPRRSLAHGSVGVATNVNPRIQKAFAIDDPVQQPLLPHERRASMPSQSQQGATSNVLPQLSRLSAQSLPQSSHNSPQALQAQMRRKPLQQQQRRRQQQQSPQAQPHQQAPSPPSAGQVRLQRPIQQRSTSAGLASQQHTGARRPSQPQLVRAVDEQLARAPLGHEMASSQTHLAPPSRTVGAQQFVPQLPNRPFQQQQIRPPQRRPVTTIPVQTWETPEQQVVKKEGRIKKMMQRPGAKIAVRLGAGLLVGGALGSQIGNLTDQWSSGDGEAGGEHTTANATTSIVGIMSADDDSVDYTDSAGVEDADQDQYSSDIYTADQSVDEYYADADPEYEYVDQNLTNCDDDLDEDQYEAAYNDQDAALYQGQDQTYGNYIPTQDDATYDVEHTAAQAGGYDQSCANAAPIADSSNSNEAGESVAPLYDSATMNLSLANPTI